jgi:hypothetical protein
MATTVQAKEIKGPARIVTVLPDSGVKLATCVGGGGRGGRRKEEGGWRKKGGGGGKRGKRGGRRREEREPPPPAPPGRAAGQSGPRGGKRGGRRRVLSNIACLHRVLFLCELVSILSLCFRAICLRTSPCPCSSLFVARSASPPSSVAIAVPTATGSKSSSSWACLVLCSW